MEDECTSIGYASQLFFMEHMCANVAIAHTHLAQGEEKLSTKFGFELVHYFKCYGKMPSFTITRTTGGRNMFAFFN